MSWEHFDAATYLRWLFLANFAAATVAAIGIARGAHTWGWLMGDAVAGGAFVSYVASRLIGPPGFHPADPWEWLRPDGLLSLALESIFVVLSLLAITLQGRALVGKVQTRIDSEETTVGEAPGRIERD